MEHGYFGCHVRYAQDHRLRWPRGGCSHGRDDPAPVAEFGGACTHSTPPTAAQRAIQY